VFVEDDVNGGLIDFASSASNDPAVKYRIVSLGAPAFTSNETAPKVAAYAVLRGNDGGGINDNRRPAVAIIARQPGLDAVSAPNGFQPEILAIEDEPFDIAGSADTFTFVNSLFRNDDDNPGLPGLDDVASRAIDGGDFKRTYKDVTNNVANFSTYQARPTINSLNEIAFVGRIATRNGLPVTELDPLTSDLLDEGVYTTRGAFGVKEFVRIAFEGDPAPVVVNGTLLGNTRFLRFQEQTFTTHDPQVFHRPVMNSKGQILFIGSWVHEPPGGEETFGRSLFLFDSDLSLRCVASSGDIIGQLRGPTGALEDHILGTDFCRVANAAGFFNNDPRSLEQATLNECGIALFTNRLFAMVGDPAQPEPRGWGLFAHNTADPRPSEGLPPIGPELVVKSSSAGANPDDEVFTLSDENGSVQVFVAGAANDFFPEGVSFGFGDAEGGDIAVHPDGTFVFGINPDLGLSTGFIGTGRQLSAHIDFDGDGVLDGCDACPKSVECGGSGGECENCLECIVIDCPFGGMLLGLGPDFDQSGLVDDTDLELMMMAMGLTKGRFDMNKDGVVGEKDLVMLLDNYGKTVQKESEAKQ